MHPGQLGTPRRGRHDLTDGGAAVSLTAMQWAMSKAPIKRNASQCRNRLVLVALADRYNDDTGVCWPSIKSISKDIGVSVPTVHKAIRSLEEAGLIARGNPRWVAHLRPDRRPTVWTLNLDMMKSEEGGREADNGVAEVLDRGEDVFTPQDERGKDVLTQRGKDVLTDGVKTSLYKPKENPNLEPKNEPKDPYARPSSERADAEAELVNEFDDWYKDYPRKTGKGAARKAFLKARKAGVEVNTLKDGLERSKRSWAVENRPKDKLPYPATWLNAESWDDEETRPQDIQPQQPQQGGGMDFVDLLNESRRQETEASRGLEYPEHNWESRGELPW